MEAGGQAVATSGLRALERPQGGFAMVALDQRESLRTMIGRGAPEASVPDEALRTFKWLAATTLSPSASAVLLDRAYGLDGTAPPELAPGCAFILAADRLIQPAGLPVQETDLDDGVTPDLVAATGAAALKLLVLWRTGDDPDRRTAVVSGFLRLCADAGVPGIVEGVVRHGTAADDAGRGGDPHAGWASDDERDDAIVAAAAEFGAHRPALYKGEVPSFGRGDPALLRDRCAEITAVLPCPWVVLSSGVHSDDFTTAVEEACAGGASGFLAGRAIWSEAAGSPDPADALRTRAVDRLRALDAVVPGRQKG
jgi:sulfofructosephosphate aldolase